MNWTLLFNLLIAFLTGVVSITGLYFSHHSKKKIAALESAFKYIKIDKNLVKDIAYKDSNITKFLLMIFYSFQRKIEVLEGYIIFFSIYSPIALVSSAFIVYYTPLTNSYIPVETFFNPQIVLCYVYILFIGFTIYNYCRVSYYFKEYEQILIFFSEKEHNN